MPAPNQINNVYDEYASRLVEYVQERVYELLFRRGFKILIHKIVTYKTYLGDTLRITFEDISAIPDNCVPRAGDMSPYIEVSSRDTPQVEALPPAFDPTQLMHVPVGIQRYRYDRQFLAVEMSLGDYEFSVRSYTTVEDLSEHMSNKIANLIVDCLNGGEIRPEVVDVVKEGRVASIEDGMIRALEIDVSEERKDVE